MPLTVVNNNVWVSEVDNERLAAVCTHLSASGIHLTKLLYLLHAFQLENVSWKIEWSVCSLMWPGFNACISRSLAQLTLFNVAFDSNVLHQRFLLWSPRHVSGIVTFCVEPMLPSSYVDMSLTHWLQFIYCTYNGHFKTFPTQCTVGQHPSLLGTAAAAPPPFRPGNPALCGSCPLFTPYYCRLGDLLCYSCTLYLSTILCVYAYV